jgi:hypothetical protein
MDKITTIAELRRFLDKRGEELGREQIPEDRLDLLERNSGQLMLITEILLMTDPE